MQQLTRVELVVVFKGAKAIERTARKVYRACDEAMADVFDYIERFYRSSCHAKDA